MSEKIDYFNVHVIEDHNDALEFIYKEIGSRKLNFSNLIMIHFDSHPDLGIPCNFNADLVFKKDQLLESLSIENWILPAVYAGHVETVIWIKPKWSDQINCGEYKIIVGKEASSNLIRCNCKEIYFLSDGLYSNEANLINKRELRLYVCDFDFLLCENDIFLSNIFSSLKTSDKRVILDVDLDFFSTNDPFKLMFAESAEFDLFKSIYALKMNFDVSCVDFDSKYQQFITEKQLRNEKILKILTKLVDSKTDVETNESSIDFSKLKQFAHVIKRHNIDLEIIHGYGCGLDYIGLPHNVSSNIEIEEIAKNFALFLEKYFSFCLQPSLVTIARSSLDNYCPVDQVEFIQEAVLGKIDTYFRKFINKIAFHY